MPVPKDLQTLEQWKGLKSIGMATLVCVRNGEETSDTRYYISSLEIGVKQFGRAVRSHWGVENECHWSLGSRSRPTRRAARTGDAKGLIERRDEEDWDPAADQVLSGSRLGLGWSPK